MLLKKNPHILSDIPKEFRTPEIYLEALKQDGYLIKKVPKENLSHKFIKTALNNRSDALKFVPKKLVTKKILLEVAKKNAEIISWIDPKLLSSKLINQAIETDPFVLKYIPKELQTPDLCLKAIKLNIDACYYVQIIKKKHRNPLDIEKNLQEMSIVQNSKLIKETMNSIPK